MSFALAGISWTSAANGGVIQYTLDFLSIPNYVIKKGRLHAHIYGKNSMTKISSSPWFEKEMHQAESSRDPRSLFDRFRISCVPGRTWSKRRGLFHNGRACRTRLHKPNKWISLIKSGNTGALRKCSDFNQAWTTLNRLHQESGEKQLRPVPYWKYQRWHQSSSSSSSWWQWSDSWLSSWP